MHSARIRDPARESVPAGFRGPRRPSSQATQAPCSPTSGFRVPATEESRRGQRPPRPPPQIRCSRIPTGATSAMRAYRRLQTNYCHKKRGHRASRKRYRHRRDRGSRRYTPSRSILHSPGDPSTARAQARPPAKLAAAARTHARRMRRCEKTRPTRNP